MKPRSKRVRTLLYEMLRLWKNDKKQNKPDDPRLNDGLSRLIQATEEKKEIPKDEVRSLESLTKKKRNGFLGKVILETALTLLIALFLAILIRQTWFELYEIPTGSMRPTFKEQDRVVASKTDFGLNMPLETKHLSFDTSRLKRGSIVVLTTDNLDISDADTTYFGIFPAKKRYVKRLVGFPGESLYFYGGDIFILQADGKTIETIHATPELKWIEYVPFISFEGKIEPAQSSRFSRTKNFLIYHFNRPIADIEISPYQKIQSRIFSGGQWCLENPDEGELEKTRPQSFGDFFGINNFAKCRLLSPQELPKEAQKIGYSYPHAILYLEIHHSPFLPQGSLLQQNSNFPLVQTRTTWTPLLDSHVETIAKNLTTARFVVQNNEMHRYHFEGPVYSTLPLPRPVPDGIYEFIQGKAYKIGFQGYAEELPDTHPLYPASPDDVLFWYNAGIEMHPDYLLPKSPILPSRFAYFNKGSFYVLGQPLFLEDDPLLSWFHLQEITREADDTNYHAFQDQGCYDKNPPDAQFLKVYGLPIPKGHYLLLGDNHAMSIDGRFFGVVPQANIQGSPIFLLSPFGPRWGHIDQPREASPSCWSWMMIGLTLVIYSSYKTVRWRKKHRLMKEYKSSMMKF